jgi:hypothetical protein
MTRISVLLIVGFLIGYCVSAQETTIPLLQISHQGTTTVVFPAAIKELDIGSREVACKRVGDKPNCIWIKAVSDHLRPTNITILTSDDRLYVLNVAYSEAPASWVMKVDTSHAMLIEGMAVRGKYPELVEEIQKKDERPKRCKRAVVKKSKQGLRATLRDWAYQKGSYAMDWELSNRAAVPFELGRIQYWIVTDNHSKRSATQSVAVPVYAVHPETTAIQQEGKQHILVTVPTFWLTKNQYAKIVWMDKKGERYLQVSIKPRHQRKISK